MDWDKTLPPPRLDLAPFLAIFVNVNVNIILIFICFILFLLCCKPPTVASKRDWRHMHLIIHKIIFFKNHHKLLCKRLRQSLEYLGRTLFQKASQLAGARIWFIFQIWEFSKNVQMEGKTWMAMMCKKTSRVSADSGWIGWIRSRVEWSKETINATHSYAISIALGTTYLCSQGYSLTLLYITFHGERWKNCIYFFLLSVFSTQALPTQWKHENFSPILCAACSSTLSKSFSWV